MKKVLIMALIIMIMPVGVNALTGSVKITCDKTSIAANQSTTCKITGTTNEGVSAVVGNINVGNNLSLVSVSADSIWEGDGDNGNITLYTDTNKTGTFNIATFVVKAGDVTGEINTNVTLSGVAFTDAAFSETSLSNTDIDIILTKTSTTPTDPSEPTEPTKPNETGGSKDTEENPENPKTGISLPIVIFLVGLVITGIVYKVVLKKNYMVKM